MDNKRLLTTKELLKMWKASDSDDSFSIMVSNTQDQHTLKAVGEWLESTILYPDLLPNKVSEGIEALKQGRMPE
jgi:hypothetical protein